jgi:hypothetical protein
MTAPFAGSGQTISLVGINVKITASKAKNAGKNGNKRSLMDLIRFE